jgi:hypothetical protein
MCTHHRHKHNRGIKTSLLRTTNSGILKTFPSSKRNSTLALAVGRFTPIEKYSRAIYGKIAEAVYFFMHS